MDPIPFSQRVGAEPAPQIGLQEMPASLRVTLWNTFQHWIFNEDVLPGQSSRRAAQYVFSHIGWPADEARQIAYENLLRVKKWFLDEATWHRVYGFVEWLPHLIRRGTAEQFNGRERILRFASGYMKELGGVLEREGSPYRFSNSQLVPITSQTELDEVARAMESPFAGARKQIAQAITLLSMKPEPDYRNTIKESVSAIASTLMEATGGSGDFKPLLDAFEKAHGQLHPAFRRAVSSLYGWTSDENGVRHGIFGDVNVDHADARFMLVTCSAFVNFLVQHTKPSS
jgi:AbiJ-like protein